MSGAEVAVDRPAASGLTYRQRKLLKKGVLYTFLITMSLLWLLPLVWAIFVALRTQADTTVNGFVSMPQSLTLDNFTNVFNEQNFGQYYLNTLVVAIPAVIVTLLIASFVAYAISRYSWKLNLLVLLIFTAGNLLPQQVMIIPLYEFYKSIAFLPAPSFLSDSGLMYDQYIGVIFIHVVFQMGFCIFVLSNYMKTLSKELVEAALVDGAGVIRIWGAIIMPLCKPVLAALATLEFTFVYNDFFWALFLMQTGNKRPITSALQNIQGMFTTDYDKLAAGALLAAIPTIVIFLALQRFFVRGLTLGATKG